jgi:apolipoprotein D and lipocalin family protein
MRPLLLAAALLAAASPALAQKRTSAPEPAKPVPAAVYAGRWYEIARTPNPRQRTCQAPTVEFQNQGGQRSFSLTCRLGSPSGRARTQGGRIALTDGERNAKFRASFAGGIVKTDYFVLDRADDLSWAILGTSGGNYAWVLTRSPTPPAAVRQAAVARAKALGYASLEFPQQPPA